MSTEIREATEDDVDFLAWVQLAASRSHLPRGIWEYINDLSGEQTLDYLRDLTRTDVVHFGHYSLFLIAEVDGRPAAAMCGYDTNTQGISAMMQVMPALGAAAGIVYDEAFMQRAASVGAVSPANETDSWVVENVATLPEFRRQGLVAALLEATLDRGRSNGFGLAQIGVFLGNEPARKAYLKAGFEYKAEWRDPVFEAGMGCPGTERLLQPLT